MDNPFVDVEETLQRTTFDEQMTSMICMENLSNEIFYEIFDYLDVCDIFESFSNLNTRFQDLLNSSLLSLKFSRLSTSENTLQNYYEHRIHHNRQRIVSLTIWHRVHINLFFNQYPIDSTYTRLQAILLKNITSKKLISLYPNFSSLPRLSSLTIRLGDMHPDLGDVYEMMLHLLYLKYYKLSKLSSSISSTFSLTDNQTLSVLEHLNINHWCNLYQLSIILSCTSRLRRLVCKKVIRTFNDVVTSELSMRLYHLTHVSIGEWNTQFDDLEIFLRVCGQLQVLDVSTRSKDRTYLDACRWNRLISKHMPHLRKFTFGYFEPRNEMFQLTPYHSLSNLFTTSFWSEWRWFFEYVIHRDTAKYSIHSYKDKSDEKHGYAANNAYCSRYCNDSTLAQHGIHEYRSEISDSSNQTTQSTVLTLTYFGASFDENIQSFFSAVQFTHLNIECPDMPVVMLIELIHYLPQLDYLKISSMTTSAVNQLSSGEAEMFRLVSNTNKITKVYASQLKDIVDTDFLVDLCPQMEYFHVDCIDNIDLELLVVSILINRNINCIPHLQTLCLHVQKENNEFIENLQQIINVEKLLDDYSIKHIGNNIILKWK